MLLLACVTEQGCPPSSVQWYKSPSTPAEAAGCRRSHHVDRRIILDVLSISLLQQFGYP